MTPTPEPGGNPSQPARAELLALLAATRPDWDTAATARTLWEIAHAGAAWHATLWCAIQAALDPHSRPAAIKRLYEQRRPLDDKPRPEEPNEAYRQARARHLRNTATRQETPHEPDQPNT